MADVTQLLAACTSGDANQRGPAEARLKELEELDFQKFVGMLVTELGDNNKAIETRMSAAVQLKRVLTGQTEVTQRKKLEKWESLFTEEQRKYIKLTCLEALVTAPMRVSQMVANSIEAVARLELSLQRWPELVGQLVEAFNQVMALVKDGKAEPMQLQGPLSALGFFALVAAELDVEVQEKETNELLSCISQGMNAAMPDRVKVTATTALNDTLEFARHNMENEAERNMIMQMVLSMTQTSSEEVQEKAFQCLTSIMAFYYDHLPNYIEEIWKRTITAIRAENADDRVAKQALNFWDEMAYEETERREQIQEAQARGDSQPPCQLYNFIPKVQNDLCQLVLQFCLLQQPEEPEDDELDENSLYEAAEHCFVSLSACLGQSIVPGSLAFVQSNIAHADWRNRQAALFAFGALLRENPSEPLREAINALFLAVLRRMLPNKEPLQPGQDMSQSCEPVASVRQTAAWAASQVCASHYAVLQTDYLEPMLVALLESLADKPRVANMSATAIHCFASVFTGVADQDTNQLSGQLFERLAQSLWEAARREDADQWQLMEGAYEALIKVIEVSARDMLNTVGNVLLIHSLVRLGEIRAGQVRDENGFQQVELCDVVHACVLKLDKALMQVQAPGAASPPQPLVVPQKILETMVLILKDNRSSAHANAMMCIGEVTRILGSDFKHFSQHIMPIVFAGLQQNNNSATCIAAARVSIDICMALESDLAPVASDLINAAYANLKSDDVERSVKPPNLELLGDVATAVGWEGFKPYFNDAMTTALYAAQFSVDITDEDSAAFVNELREAALQAVEVMLLDAEPQHIMPFLEGIFMVARAVSLELADPRNYYQGKDPQMIPHDLDKQRLPYEVSPAVAKNVLNLIGDVASKCKESFTKPVQDNRDVFIALLNAGQNGDQDLQEAAKYAAQQLGF